MPRKLSNNPVEQDVRELLDGRVRLYKRRDSSNIWHYRIWIKDSGRYMRKSTGTPHFAEASELALDAFYDVRAKQRNNLPVFAKTFKELFKLAIVDEEKKLARGEMTQKRFDFINRIAKLYFLPFFGNRQITKITTATVQDYWNYRIDFWNQPNADEIRKKFRAMRISKNPKGSTLHLEKRVLEMVFNKAEDMNYISSQSRPRLAPPAKNEKQRRPAMTMKQWEKMQSFMRDVYMLESGSHCNEDKRRARTLLYYYCTTMVATGMRVSDMRNIKWENVQLFTDATGQKSTVLQVYGKSKHRDVVANKALYSTLMDWRKHKLNQFKEDTDFVFPNFDGKELRDQGEAFDKMKENAEKTEEFSGISTDYMDHKITVYSLRHTYAQFQIMYIGTTYDDLSKNMGNSPNVIKAHYDHVKSTDITQRLTQVPANVRAIKAVEIKQDLEHKLVTGTYAKDHTLDPMFKLLDGQISKEEYSEIVAEKKHSEA